MRKTGNLVIWIIISVLVIVTLYKVYNHFNAKAQLEPFGQQSSGNMEDDSGQEDRENESLQQDRDFEDSNEDSNGDSIDSEGIEKDEPADENKSNEKNDESNEKFLAPDFTLEDVDGKNVSLSDYRGKIVFLNFWATWCQYCVMEMPDLEEVHQEFSKGNDAVILTVNSDKDPDMVRKFMDKNGLTLPVLMDYTDEVNWMYGVSGIPVTYIIDRDGYAYGRIPGMTDKNTILQIFENIK